MCAPASMPYNTPIVDRALSIGARGRWERHVATRAANQRQGTGGGGDDDDSWVLQQYIERPLTVMSGRKFDLRLYLVLTYSRASRLTGSHRVAEVGDGGWAAFLYGDGMLRVCAAPYEPLSALPPGVAAEAAGGERTSWRTAHLANTAVNHSRQQQQPAAPAAAGVTATPTAAAAVSRPFPSWNRSILTEISLCHVCSGQEILRAETAGQADTTPPSCTEPLWSGVRAAAHTPQQQQPQPPQPPQQPPPLEHPCGGEGAEGLARVRPGAGARSWR
jgi:hypothetical protein